MDSKDTEFHSIKDTADFHSIFERVRGELLCEFRNDPSQLNPLTLAYIGDTVYDLAVRSKLVCDFNAKPNALHLMAAQNVCASAQARAASMLLPDLTEEECSIFMRARNCKPGTVPKNASPENYALASALEAVIGWLYLKGNDARMFELLKKSLDFQIETHLPNKKAFRPKR